MTRQFTFRNYKKLLDHVIQHGHVHENTREIVNFSFMMKNPRNRIVTDPARKMNPAFAIAEWLSYMGGIDDIDYFTRFVTKFSHWSSDGKTLDGAYGPRLIAATPRYLSQIEAAIDMLLINPDSRRAVLTIYNAADLVEKAGGKNTPCTLTLQFLIRKGALDMVVNMRSNDVIYGLTNDAFCFTMIQEYVARMLHIPLGRYFHNAASFHIYDEHLPSIPRYGKDYRWTQLMGEMPELNVQHNVSLMISVYKNLESYTVGELFTDVKEGYWRDLAMVGKAFLERHTSAGIHAYSFVTDPTLRKVLRPWLEPKED